MYSKTLFSHLGSAIASVLSVMGTLLIGYYVALNVVVMIYYIVHFNIINNDICFNKSESSVKTPKPQKSILTHASNIFTRICQVNK